MATPAQKGGAEQPQPPVFDVVSVKPHTDEGMMMRMMIRPTPDGFSANGISLEMLLRQTFDLPPDRILNEPDWAKSARYDIDAKVAPEDAPKLEPLTPKQRMAMLLPVLEDRFGLKFHNDTRNLSVCMLVVAKGGPKLAQAKPGDDSAEMPPSKPLDGAGGGPTVMKPDPGVKPMAGMPRMMMRMSTQGMTMEARGATMAALAQAISQQIDTTVVDKTGLTGKYDFTLSFTPDMAMGPMTMAGPGGGPPPDGPPQKQEAQGPSIFTALQEQLGLKLEAQKGQVEEIIVDHIDRPSPN